MYQRQKQFLTAVGYGAAVLGICYLAIRYALVWLLPFLLALALAAAVEPLIALLRRKMHLKRGFLAAVLTLAVVGLVVTLLLWLLSQLWRQSIDFLQRLPQLLAGAPQLLEQISQRLDTFCAGCPASMRQWVEDFFSTLSDQFSQAAGQLSGVLLRFLTSLAGALPQAALFCGTTVLAIFFTASSFPQLKAFLLRQLSQERLAGARAVKGSVVGALVKWLRAQLLLISITFFQLLAGFLLLRQPYALLLAVLIALIDALPVFGTGTVLLPWAVVCFLAGGMPKGIALTALYTLIFLVRSIMEPKLMASQAGLSPLVALLAMYVGFCAMGVGGMILFPLLLLLVKQLHDSGVIAWWK